ncbi:subclass B3 metallo-beta-lactamase [Chitinophaga agrisoli]|uniref:Subclass B3 metallo-beta-lactamase n=1 Tax=Chitinophaga agrisoli TaxID=2607653 RepID=A0A5B2W0T2_9BACT|nr:subclass B3 metallo-beta-lactamase [Chitinophaga agrisoli]KAA2243869.1 subclass B3 metallo-beta-lactamase [Chitinophaga agrisoli]
MFIGASGTILLATLFLLSSIVSNAQDVREPRISDAEWTQPYQPFRIAGNLYYVGTYELACYLITTDRGNILINTGTAASLSQITGNIRTLGFKPSDTRILLTTQAHYDHVGAMAAMKKATGAQFMADEGDVAVLADGGNSDYSMGGNGNMFVPVKADRILHNGDTIRLGDMKLVMLHHPGHTKGSCSFLFTVKDGQRTYKVLIANMPSIVTSKRFADLKTYPGISRDYAYTLAAMKRLSFDIWLASHAGQFNLHDKHTPGDAYNPRVFMDKDGYNVALRDLQQEYDKKMKE